jgi:hypothetical protein
VISSKDPTSGSSASTWLSVSDDLLWGFNHALSNRLAAITSIARILEYSDTGLDPLLAALNSEIGTLEETLKLLRLVPRDSHAYPEPVLPEDLVPQALRLHGLRSDASDLEFETTVEGEPQPVWIRPGSLAHAILIALAAVSRDALAAGDRRVRVRVTTTEDLVTIAVLALAAHGGDSAVPDREREAVNELAAEGGGSCVSIDDAGGERGVEIRLPTLIAVRRREREEATSGG